MLASGVEQLFSASVTDDFPVRSVIAVLNVILIYQKLQGVSELQVYVREICRRESPGGQWSAIETVQCRKE
jgi:hypothetical protein